MDFDRLFKEMDSQMKEDFLYKLLKKNESLQNQFMGYCKQPASAQKEKKPATNPEKLVEKLFSDCREELEMVDCEDVDWSDYTPRHGGYIPEYEAIENYAEDQFEVIFKGWREILQKEIQDGLLLKATCFLLGSYDACTRSEIPGSDNVFGDITGTLLGFHKDLLQSATDEAESVMISDEQSVLSAEAVLKHYQAEHKGMTGYLKYFETWLIVLTGNEQVAGKILGMTEQMGIEDSLFPAFIMKLNSFGDKKETWLQKAEKFVYKDLDVARELLDYYLEHDIKLFLKHGKKLFREHPDVFCDYFYELLTPGLDQDFFVEVLRYKAIHERKFDFYEELRGFLDQGGKESFIRDIQWDDVFKVKVLEREGWFDEILKLVQKEGRTTWHFTELITPILNRYPAEVFDLIRLRCESEIREHKNRDAYHRISEWLGLAIQIKAREQEAYQLIHALYNHKPALPALKDEMRKAGVV
jgi:hypothetical protein